MLKKFKFALLILIGSYHLSLSAQTLRFASSATYPPFEFLDANNQLAGFDIDLAKALCIQMQATCTFSNHVFDGLIPALKFKRYDVVISGMDITVERSKQVAFTVPYFKNSALFVAQKGKAYSSIEQLNQQRVGTVNGTTHQKFILEHHPEIKLIPYDSYLNAIEDLKNHRLQAVFGDTHAVREWLKTNANLAPVGVPIINEKYFGTGLGIAVRNHNNVLLERLNFALQQIKDNGTYRKIVDKWFPEP